MVQISKPPVPIKLYRHFAVVTLALTAAIAMFATGEGEEQRQAAQQPRASQAAAAAPRPSSTPRYGEASLAQRGGGGEFGDEAASGNDFGRPSIRAGDSRFIQPSALPPPNSENAAFTDAYLDTLTEEELTELLRAMREGGIEDAERRQATAIMEAASRRRSGGAATVG
jgi:hypothetical protein